MMHILLRDVRELEELVTEHREAGSFDPLDMELLRTRISGVRHLLELAAERPPVGSRGAAEASHISSIGSEQERDKVPAGHPAGIHREEAPTGQPQGREIPPSTHFREADAVTAAAVHPDPESNTHQEIPFAVPSPVLPGPEREEAPTVRQEIPPVSQASAVQQEIPLVSQASAVQQEIPPISQAPAPSGGSGEMLFTGERVETERGNGHAEKQILGEKFTAGKSVHDLLMTEKTKNELKFSNIPIASLAGSIGTNDRFLFARELFEGNMELFYDTVRRIDQMHEVREAFNYLSERYNWKKSETSLKFVELVKRRFPQNG